MAICCGEPAGAGAATGCGAACCWAACCWAACCWAACCWAARCWAARWAARRAAARAAAIRRSSAFQACGRRDGPLGVGDAEPQSRDPGRVKAGLAAVLAAVRHMTGAGSAGHGGRPGRGRSGPEGHCSGGCRAGHDDSRCRHCDRESGRFPVHGLITGGQNGPLFGCRCALGYHPWRWLGTGSAGARQRRADVARIRATALPEATVLHAGCCRSSTLPNEPQRWDQKSPNGRMR